MSLLAVDDLAVTFRTSTGAVPAVEGVSFRVEAGETLALVGESSSGKSVTALALMRLLGSPPGVVVRGSVALEGEAVLALPERRMAGLRGGKMAMIFQEPMTSLNPVLRIGEQIAEAMLAHGMASGSEAARRAVALLDEVGIPDPAVRARSFPHLLSGGMRQRAMIAMALACGPKLLIADEPTTALDVTVQAQILDLIRRKQQESGMAVIFITHNLGVVAQIADRVLVMYAGQIVEAAPAGSLLGRPLMPYSQGLIASVPSLEHVRSRAARLAAIPGNVPDPQARPPACTFAPRCPHVVAARCETARPALEAAGPGHDVRCVRWRELAA